MSKRTVFSVICSVFFVIAIVPTYAMADFFVVPVNKSPLAGPKTSICEFPYWETHGGNLSVYYDLRTYDPDYFSSQQPPGGIKFEIFFGDITSTAERDALVAKISKVIFYNSDTGEYYELNQADTYVWNAKPAAEYSIWLGYSDKVKGNWETIIIADGIKYSGTFTLTQDMLSSTAPIALDPEVTSDGSKYTVTAPLTNGEQYRFRVFDASGDLAFEGNMTVDNQSGNAWIDVDTGYAGYTARIETRIYTDQWLNLMNWGDLQSCNSNGGVVGISMARAINYIKIQVVQ